MRMFHSVSEVSSGLLGARIHHAWRQRVYLTLFLLSPSGASLAQPRATTGSLESPVDCAPTAPSACLGLPKLTTSPRQASPSLSISSSQPQTTSQSASQSTTESTPQSTAQPATKRPLMIDQTHSHSPSSDRPISPRGALNVFGTPLRQCCVDPVTGFERDGYCHTGAHDRGVHVVCAHMTEDFLAYTKRRGNDLSTPRPEYGFVGLKPGDRWCLCVSRWAEAERAGVAPPVDLSATQESALRVVPLSLLKKYALETQVKETEK